MMILSLVLFITASGLLKGFDPLLNLVLDEATEYLRGRLTQSMLGENFNRQTFRKNFLIFPPENTCCVFLLENLTHTFQINTTSKLG